MIRCAEVNHLAQVLPLKVIISATTVDFFTNLRQVYPLPAIVLVQNDNGSTSLGEFEHYLKQEDIRQQFIYPKCPKINVCVERYQRTLSEEFINMHADLVRTPRAFQRQLADCLGFYNCQRPHAALDQLSPMQQLVAEGVMSIKSVTHTPS